MGGRRSSGRLVVWQACLVGEDVLGVIRLNMYEDHVDWTKTQSSPSSEGLRRPTKVVNAVPVLLGGVLNAVGPVDFLKLDVEGSEESILTRTRAAWLSAVRQISVEWHGGVDRESCGRALSPMFQEVVVPYRKTSSVFCRREDE